MPPVPPQPSPVADDDKDVAIRFQNTPIDQLLDFYGEVKNKTILRAPGLPGQTTLQTRDRVPRSEVADLIEGYLVLCGVALVEDGKVLRAVAVANAHRETQKIVAYDSAPPAETARGILTRLIVLRHLTPNQAVELLSPLKLPAGVVQPIDTLNAVLITDSAPNLRRMKSLLSDADMPMPAPQIARFINIKHRRASVLKAELDGLFGATAPARGYVSATQPIPPQPAAIPGIIRAPSQPSPVSATSVSAESPLVRGPVAILADDDIGVLIVLSRPENFVFIDKVIATLDQPPKESAGIERTGGGVAPEKARANPDK
jgi:type II secretory pathway component GspD/PulD (secretin)